MSALIAGIVASGMICTQPAMSFREFYASYFYAAPKGTYWAGARNEDTFIVVQRMTEAVADFQDYRVERRERCK